MKKLSLITLLLVPVLSFGDYENDGISFSSVIDRGICFGCETKSVKSGVTKYSCQNCLVRGSDGNLAVGSGSPGFSVECADSHKNQVKVGLFGTKRNVQAKCCVGDNFDNCNPDFLTPLEVARHYGKVALFGDVVYGGTVDEANNKYDSCLANAQKSTCTRGNKCCNSNPGSDDWSRQLGTCRDYMGDCPK